MAKIVHDSVLDAAFAVVDDANRMVVCNAQPTTYAEVTTFKLAEQAMVPGDYIVANGDTSGRKVTIGAKSGVTIATSGTANHIALANSGNSTLLYVTTCTSQALTNGNTVNIPAWKIEIADPT